MSERVRRKDFAIEVTTVVMSSQSTPLVRDHRAKAFASSLQVRLALGGGGKPAPTRSRSLRNGLRRRKLGVSSRRYPRREVHTDHGPVDCRLPRLALSSGPTPYSGRDAAL